MEIEQSEVKFTWSDCYNFFIFLCSLEEKNLRLSAGK